GSKRPRHRRRLLAGRRPRCSRVPRARLTTGGLSMRSIEGEQVLVRIFIAESDQWHHRPLHMALLERLRRDGFAGATVTRAVAGFGARSVIHTAQILRLSEDLPM